MRCLRKPCSTIRAQMSYKIMPTKLKKQAPPQSDLLSTSAETSNKDE